MWTFEEFFDCAHKILDMRVVDVFSISTSQILKIYIDPRHSLAEFQEEIAKQTGIHASAQNLYYDNEAFFPDTSVKCENFPQTTEKKPLFVVDKGVTEFPRPMPQPQRMYISRLVV